MSTEITPQNTALVMAYLDGDPDAIDIIDTSVEVARTVTVIRDLDHRLGPDDHYDEIRNDCDQACDSLLEPFMRAEYNALIGPHVL